MTPLFASSENQTLDEVMDRVGDAVCVSDETMTFLGANRAFAAFYNLKDPSILIGKNAFEVYPDFRKSVFYEACSRTIESGETTTRVGYSSHLKCWYAIRCAKLADNRYTMIATRLSENFNKGGYVATHDGLTSLPNRWAFEQDATDLKGFQQQMVLALIDISHFKNLNDRLGLDAGDRCLMEVGARIKGAARLSDRVYRVGDDEFLILGTEDRAGFAARLKAVAAALAQPMSLSGQECIIQANVGVCWPSGTDSVQEALKKAEIALEHAKTRKSGHAVYTDDMGLASYDPVLTKEIKDALRRDEMVLFFQPQVDLVDGKMCGAEVLIRWQHPTRGLVPPVDFIPFAEETGLIQDIDQYVIEKAFEAQAAFMAAGTPVPLSVNLSAQSVCNMATVELFDRCLERTGISPELMCVEITETSLMHDIKASERVIEALKARGFAVAIDDFGSGQSSMAYLLRYPSQFLKVDRDFVRHITTSDTHRIIIKNMIGLAHGLGIAVVAEGVETEETCAVLRDLRCDIVQGYIFSRPVGQTDFQAWAAQHGVASLASDIH